MCPLPQSDASNVSHGFNSSRDEVTRTLLGTSPFPAFILTSTMEIVFVMDCHTKPTSAVSETRK